MMAKKWAFPLVGLLSILIAAITMFNPLNVLAQQEDEGEFTWAGTDPAPDFPEGLTWINVPEALTWEQLRGKIVILDFWTYGCVNCMHIIPDLKRIEAEYPNEVVVIGIHSAKFENESVTANIRQIVQRYGITHPVVNDNELVLMQQIWRAPAWPTVAVIDPLGRVVGGESGEGIYEILKPVLETMVAEYGEAELLDLTPITLTPETDNLVDTPLLFPGKVIADEAGRRLFIADTGHNRIVVASLDNYEVLQVIGTGEASLVDGDFATATFNSPQGMALVGETLYVADTNNHAVRAIDLANQTVTLVAGTGQVSPFQLASGMALEMNLRSPWDVLEKDGTLYIAMAGSHQIFALDLADMTLKPYVGDGGEDLIDGDRLSSSLAQPSGLAADDEYIYFADSEASAIRRVSLGQDGQVETLIGPVNAEQGRLFLFGDMDGGLDEALLQHPLGVTLSPDGMVYIADTYNNKLKIIDPAAKTSQTFAGLVEGGYYDGNVAEALFDEPGGLDYSEGKLYVADTNNHLIRVIDLENASVTSIIFPNVTALLPESSETPDEITANLPTIDSNLLPPEEPLILPPQTVAPGSGFILVDAVMPFGYKLNAQAPFTAVWAANDLIEIAPDLREYEVVTPSLPIEFPASFFEGQTELSVDLTIYWCEAINETLCFVERKTVLMPISVEVGANASVLQLPYQLTPPEVQNEGFGN